MTEEDKKYRQGRRKEPVEGHLIMAMIGIIGVLMVLMFVAFITQ